MRLGYTDPCPLGQAIRCNPKLYDAEVLSLRYVKPYVHDTKEILNDAEESQVKMKERQFQVNYENINKESDVPSKKMTNESKLLKLFVNSNNEIKKLGNFNIDRNMDKHITVFHDDREITEEVYKMFESMESKVDRTSKKNEFLQNKIDQLLEANIANDVRNLVMQSYVDIINNDETERFLKESKDGELFCNDAVQVKEKLSKQNV
uniref:Uncharacterized protein n=1 Tax=Tanacetum cinerariifolium TaxID=118510 RepID=A0A699GQ89_TANCI|nr:hypothetical protein [Tanacetum cinerariifolium]